MEFDLQVGFPAVTTKKLAWKSVVSELLWMLEGSTDERRLAEIHYGTRDPNKTTIWTANLPLRTPVFESEYADTHRSLGPIYGAQWRDFNGVDQIQNLIQNLKDDPFSRRHIISAWNPADLDKMALPPCHLLAQFSVSNENRLSCQMYQRSADMGLGVPFNIASYSLLTHILAQITGYDVGKFIHVIGDAHIYENHIEQINLQLERIPYEFPTIKLPNFDSLDQVLALNVSDFQLIDYKYHPSLKMEMAV